MLWFYGSILPDVIQDTLCLFYSYLAGLFFGATLDGNGGGSFLNAFHNAFGSDCGNLFVGSFVYNFFIAVLRNNGSLDSKGLSFFHGLG